MGNTGKISFAGYDFPSTFRPADVNDSQDTGAQPRPRAAGSVSQRGRREATRLLVFGELVANSPDELRTKIRVVKAAAFSGKGDLYFGRDDEYYRDAQCKSWGESNEQGKLFGVFASLSLEWEAADHPYPYSTNVLSPVLSPGGSTITGSGEATALPIWTITIGSGGTGPLTLHNAANGQTALLDPGTGGFAGGEVIVLKRDGYTVTRNGVASFGLLKLRIPTIEPGSNAITLTAGGTATVASLTVSYAPRLA
ncbi:MAG: hypothetical protein V4671_04755 [Armatimonadota bacterium]